MQKLEPGIFTLWNNLLETKYNTFFVSEIVDGNVKMTLGMIWTIILRFAIQDISVEGEITTHSPGTYRCFKLRDNIPGPFL